MRNIWMYWETAPGGTKPAYLDLCENTIERWKNGLVLHLLDEHTIHDFLPDLRPDVASLSLNHKSDYYRSRLVHQYGGIWLDADVIALRPLDELLGFIGGNDVALYGREPSDLSANCFVALAGSSLLAKWIELQDETMDAHAAIPWNGLGKTPLVKAASGKTFSVLPVERIAPIHWQKWQTLLSRWRSPERPLRNDPILFMLYNKFLHDAFGDMSAVQILEGNMLISKIFRRALSPEDLR